MIFQLRLNGAPHFPGAFPHRIGVTFQRGADACRMVFFNVRIDLVQTSKHTNEGPPERLRHENHVLTSPFKEGAVRSAAASSMLKLLLS